MNAEDEYDMDLGEYARCLGYIDYDKSSYLKKIRGNPGVIIHFMKPNIKIQSEAYFNANFELQKRMRMNPKSYNMENFFRNNSYLLLANDTGIFDE